MFSKDIIYNKNYLSPAQVTREDYPARGSGINTLGYVKRAFKGGTDFEIWTAQAGGTQLVENTDYTLVNTDSALTGEAGFDVYVDYQITNATYQNVNLFFTYKVIASAIDGEMWQSDRLEGFERQAVIDCNFQSWEEGTSFTNPNDNSYTATMFVAKRSGTTADSVIFSQDTASAETSWNSTLKMEVTAVGTDTSGVGLTGIEYRVDDFEKLKGKDVVFRTRIKVPDGEEVRLVIDYGIGTIEETFVGFGDWQDVFIQGTISAGSTQVYLRYLVRDTANSIIPVVDDYFIQNVLLHVGETPIPFIKKSLSDVKKQVLYYFESIDSSKMGGASFFIRIHSYNSANLFFHSPIARKRIAPTLTFTGTQGVDWSIRAISGTTLSGFSFSSSTTSILNFLIVFNKTSHGFTDAFFQLLGSSNGKIKLDSRL